MTDWSQFTPIKEDAEPVDWSQFTPVDATPPARRGGTAREARPYLAPDPAITEGALARATPTPVGDGALSGDFISGFRDILAQSPPEQRLNALKAYAENDKGVYGRAARSILADVTSENKFTRPEDEALAAEVLKLPRTAASVKQLRHESKKPPTQLELRDANAREAILSFRNFMNRKIKIFFLQPHPLEHGQKNQNYKGRFSVLFRCR